MNIRFAGIGSLTSGRSQCCGILIFILALGVPGPVYTQIAAVSQPQTNPAQNPRAVKEADGKAPAEQSKAGAITDVKAEIENGRLVVTVMTDRLLAPNAFQVEDPPRLVLDFPNTENKVQFSRLRLNAASVKRLRVQQFQGLPHMIARVVFDLAEDSVSHEITLDRSFVRVVFDAGPSKSGSAKINPDSGQAISRVESRDIPRLPEAPPGADSSESQAARPFSGIKVSLPDPAGSPAMAAALPAPARQSAVQPVRILPRAGSPQADLELSVKSTPAQAPLVAALMPSSISVPPVALPSPNSRYTGQPLTLDLVDISLVDFFRLMAEEGGINIVMDPEITGSTSIKVVKVPWDQIFDAVLANNGLDKQVEGTLVRIARKKTLQEEAKQQESLKKANLLAADLETRIKRLNYAKAAAFVEALADQKTVRGSVVVDERSNSLILTDIPSSLNRLIQLVETLDMPQPQVEIEARIVSASRDFARDIGIQFGFVQGNLQRVTIGGPNTFGTIGGTRPSATPTSTYAAGNPITGRGASESDSTESAAISTGTTSNDKGNYNVNLPANRAFGGLGISVGNIFDTFLLDAAITAGENKGLAKLISQPKVTAQNNSPAVITQGLRFPVQIVANNTVTVQFQNAALTLTVTPQITYEGNIVLDLKVENNTPDFSNQVHGVPSIRTSESSTRVLVSDGGTTVIGGILVDNEANQEDRVPGLASLPLVGNLFKRTSVSRSTQEVLFFVTPRIVK
jgi:type IV pilus assembly protein PilQ